MDINFLRVDAIQILDNRQRKAADEAHIKSLATDITENGLIHPLTISHDGVLVAGFCRLTAIRSIAGDFKFGADTVPRGFVPVVKLDRERTALDLFRIEFAENEKRANLSPVERSAALAHLHRNLEAVAKESGKPWTKQDTAAEVVKLEGGTPAPTRQNDIAGEVSDAIIIDSFKDDPDVANAPSKAVALKVARKKLEEQFTQMLGAKVVQERPAQAQDDSLRVYNIDFRTIPFSENSFHGIICDPPYGVDADKFGDQSYVSGHEYQDTTERALEIADAVFNVGFASVRDGGHLYMFCDIRQWPALKALAEKAGWVVYPTPLIWDKGFGHAPQVGFFSRQYETILFAAKGMTRKLLKTTADVFKVPGVRDKLHAAQKPVELYAQLMKLSFFPGERVVDFTCGSGTIFKAAAEVGLRADGYEIDEKYANICQNTIAGLLASQGLSPPMTLPDNLDDDDEDVLPTFSQSRGLSVEDDEEV